MKRDIYLDSVAGLLIVYMILLHCMQSAQCENTSLYHWMNVLFFFMPWFFFKSGMYYNGRGFDVMSSANKLLLPYILYSTIGHIEYMIILMFKGVSDPILYIRPLGKFFTIGSTDGNLPLWFLASLFIVQFLFDFLRKKNVHATVIAFGCLFLACVLHFVDFGKPYYLANVITGTFFYAMGYVLKNLQWNKFCVLLSISVYLYIFIFHLSIVSVFSNSLLSGYYILWFPSSIAGIILINNFFKKNALEIIGLHCIGKYSMNLYVTHWLVIMFVSYVVRDLLFITDRIYVLICLILSNITLLPICNYYMLKYDLIRRLENRKLFL